MIFERHFEDKEEEDGDSEKQSDGVLSGIDMSAGKKEEELSVNSEGNQPNSDACSIDAEPYQFLDSPKVPSTNAKEQKLPQSKKEEKPKPA